MDEHLCHVTTAEACAVEQIAGIPFLHCCTEQQLRFVLERHFAGRTGLIVLRFDPAVLVDGHIDWERSEEGMDPFPHLYGKLPVSLTRADPAPLPWA